MIKERTTLTERPKPMKRTTLLEGFTWDKRTKLTERPIDTERTTLNERLC